MKTVLLVLGALSFAATVFVAVVALARARRHSLKRRAEQQERWLATMARYGRRDRRGGEGS